jgi:Na+-driven multidrug efflux pump
MLYGYFASILRCEGRVVFVTVFLLLINVLVLGLEFLLLRTTHMGVAGYSLVNFVQAFLLLASI